MIPRLILRHEIMHTLTKPLLITVTTVTLILNLLAYQMARTHSPVLVEGTRTILAQFAFLIPIVVILLMGKADRRCRPWETGLPLESRALWGAYLGALVLGFVALICVAGIAFVGFGYLVSQMSDKPIFRIPELAYLVLRPGSASLAAACLVAAWNPQAGRLDEVPGWSRMKVALVLATAGILGVLVLVPPVFAVVPAAAGLLAAWRAGRTLPAALDMGGDSSAGGLTGAAGIEWAEVAPSGRVVRTVVLRTLFKWPVSWLALAPIAAAFGAMVSGSRVLGVHEPYLRFTNFFIVVYLLFAMSNHFMENLHKVDHLPIDRRALLRWMVLPVALFFLAGYGVGVVSEDMSDRRPEEILFDNTGESYGLKVRPDYWSLSLSSQARTATAPWGESHELESVPVIEGLPMTLWKPYSTPVDASREFVAWQISRAAAEAYGLEVSPGEIADRYLETDLYGRTTMRAGGLTLMADYAQARNRGSGPVFPFWVGAEFIALMIVNGMYFRAFRPGITIKKGRILFWLIMGGLMALHIGGYVLFIQGVTREWIVYAFWMGRLREIGQSGPVGTGAVWAAAALGLWLAWRWAEKSFLGAEAPSS